MSDQLHLQSSPKIFGAVVLSAVIGYFGFRAIDIILFKDSFSTNMFSWILPGSPKLLRDPNENYKVKLIRRTEVSHDTRIFRFELPSKNHVLGLPTGKHIFVSATINDQVVVRKYTPITSDDNKGYFELIIKVYFSNVHPKYPEGGKLTQYLESLKIGDTIDVRGPAGKLEYLGKGNFHIKGDKDSDNLKKHVKQVSMIAGGSGIAPMLQIVREVLKNNTVDKTKIALLFANQSEDDILLRNELDELASKYRDQFKVWYTVDRPKENWTFSSGFVSKEMIQDHLYKPDDESLLLLCGPPPMIKFIYTLTDELGYARENIFKY